MLLKPRSSFHKTNYKVSKFSKTHAHNISSLFDMFSARPSRLFVIKFLGLWGTTVNDQSNKHSPTDDTERTDIESKQQDLNSDVFAQLENNRRHVGTQEVSKKLAIKASQRKIQDLLLEKGVPGLTVCVSRRGQILWESAFGYCDVENQLLCEPDALMRIASISKSLFAATLVGPLIDEKEIDLNTSIHNYLSLEEFPRKHYNGKQFDITIEQLLSHTSGIKHYDYTKPEDLILKPLGSKKSKKIYQDNDQYSKLGFYQQKTFRSVIEALEPFKNEPLTCEPGNYKYTTYGYTLLSAVIERLYQKQAKYENEHVEDIWIKVLRRTWFLDNTHLDQHEVILPKRARYYMRTAVKGGLINAPYTDVSIKWAGGGIISNTQDLVKFGQMLVDCYKDRKTGVLKKETIDLLWKEKKDSYALGFQIKTKVDVSKDKLVVFHDGGALGASSTLVIYPDSEIVVAILTNLDSVSLSSLGFFIANQFERLE